MVHLTRGCRIITLSRHSFMKLCRIQHYLEQRPMRTQCYPPYGTSSGSIHFFSSSSSSSPSTTTSSSSSSSSSSSHDENHNNEDESQSRSNWSSDPNTKSHILQYSSKYGIMNVHDHHDRPQYDSIPSATKKWEKFPNGSRFWKKATVYQTNHSNENNTKLSGRFQRPIFVAATKQHVGKTTCSLALISGLKKRFEKVGFLKPVGQQHVEVFSEERNEMMRVDKDVCLVREHFKLHHIDYKDMSPVIIPDGYTRKYVDGVITLNSQIDTVLHAMTSVAQASDIVLCEGTGHCAVGSIVGLNNAKVASLIGADMVLVANGGLGSAFDELELNRILCQHYNVRVAGVILNKVIPSKYEQTKHYMSKAMLQSWGVPLLGCIPDRPFLGCPALADLEHLFKTKLICGDEYRFRHYSFDDINVVTTSLTRFLENLREKPTRTLYICHITRDDLIVGFMVSSLGGK
jgi:dethiobiotin synthetase